MNTTRTARWLLFLFVVLAGCTGPRSMPPPADTAAPADRTIEAIILQLNDVYEITPVEGGKRGGLARVATLRQRLLEENPYVFTVMAGDFYSPSALGTARVDGERLAGKQMVAVLNALGLDVATFGNHEFDVNEEQFVARLGESDFTYITGNVFDAHGEMLPKTERNVVFRVPGAGGDTLRIGMIGATLRSNPVDYISYTDPIAAMRDEAGRLRGRVQALAGLTHLALEQDIELARILPELDLIMGGHEHENIQVWRGPDLTPITKADANARTVYVHRLRYDPATDSLVVRSQLRLVTDALPDEPATAAVVDTWVGRAFQGFRDAGLKPGEPVVTLTEALDGLESSVRNHPTTLTDLIADAMLHAAGDADLAVFNSGSIRIDDVLQPGTLIQYDVIRVLPFGGDVLTVEMPGSLLDSTLTQGIANQGTGGYLQHAGVTRTETGWLVDGQPLNPNQTYQVAINDFLVSGNETNLGYLTLTDPRLKQVAEHGDIRLAVIEELKRKYD